jgi:3',5'-cyclic AMP phosphodiesterase CpdA
VVDTSAALQRCVSFLNGLDPPPAAVICSGDLVDGGKEAEYEHLERILAPLTPPLLAIPGNHDRCELMRRTFPDQPYAAGSMNMVVKLGDVDLVLLDSSVPEKSHGLLEAPTLAWLEATLAAETERPALIFLHHPPFNTGIRHMDIQNLHNAADLADIVLRHRRVVHVAAGHVHRSIFTLFAAYPPPFARRRTTRSISSTLRLGNRRRSGWNRQGCIYMPGSRTAASAISSRTSSRSENSTVLLVSLTRRACRYKRRGNIRLAWRRWQS